MVFGCENRYNASTAAGCAAHVSSESSIRFQYRRVIAGTAGTHRTLRSHVYSIGTKNQSAWQSL
ncbi:hypothetical protein PAMC26577_33470 [Caballeronia sordidicola]|uniref:Uncharacterized protein n=1 Tax=Caballeronia sordidicola TaxID=196367 RepID=A0A242MAK0_CABSO|nr:hypothetical protein PAMC26577_33470 [Caballeronia sordidicola]